MKRALYAGSFDPITNGHLDIITRGAKLADELVVGVMKNLSKKPFFTMDERSAMIKACTSHLPNVKIDMFEGLLARYVKENQIDVVIRGLRAITDFEAERQMAQMNARLYGDGVETIFLVTTPVYSFVSSGLVREVFSLDGEIRGLVPDIVYEELKRKFGK